MVNNILNLVKNLFLPAKKNDFCQPGFYHGKKRFFSTGWQKPANPGSTNFVKNWQTVT